ncbi:hypothetical protein [Streptomyces griseochromogenes]|uniref:hypothetical protein n=1 Tax=Streptomyces griseochromogenes TaxID=68214 RepID=UPI0037946EAC
MIRSSQGIEPPSAPERFNIAHIINRGPSLVSQFYTKNKGAAFVTALQQVLTAVEAGGITDVPELATIAGRYITRRTTASGARARVRGKAVLITPTGSGTGRVGHQAIALPAPPACAL